jgi:hypothetical protein
MTQHILKEGNIQEDNNGIVQLNQELEEDDKNLIRLALGNHFLFKDKTENIM